METLHNELLTVEVSDLGAELQSIKDDEGKEYLWQGDDRYWGRRSPILFPIVCGLWKGTYRTEGDTYQMGRHGFARDMNFRVLKKADDRLTYVLSDTEATLRQYPYRFMLSVTYKLVENEIHVIWHVHNTDTREIHFQIGAHPAFNLPGVKEGEPIKGCLRFDRGDKIERIYGNHEGCITDDRYELEGCNGGLWAFNEESFKDDAVIIDKCQLREIEILDPQTARPAVTVSFNAPCVGIWTPYGKNAPFLCIEPWYGVHDHYEYRGQFRDKYLMNHLQPGASFMSEYIIKIGE
ncbi:aldose 1-epimerase family protein [Leyella stercorea]|uniref:aldose 1-epimerase family protein n=1 Tax=Leyella stercorea TaxID=363265 RepID=UPI00242A7E84|nr:aldose 1-epimerase family protein [Leyella stercorea]